MTFAASWASVRVTFVEPMQTSTWWFDGGAMPSKWRLNQ
jgi:hypothetical protein